ncbi:hypothetical protein RRF57_004562 [Xylaria bambusicola]|uniref:Pisatin demethylase n=1 Tax=Xylaria bambusicola TaxID=326684 RepID=A0AAN7Z3Z7_9PEZI
MDINFIHLAWGSFILWYLISSITTWYKLRHVPGPFLAKFSYLWLARTALGTAQWYIQDDVHRGLCETYGPLVRIGPNELTTNDPEILRRAGAVRGSYGKGRWYVGSRFNPYRDVMFTTLDVPAHDKLKSQIGASFGGRDIPLLEPGMDEQLQALIANIRQNMSSNPGNGIDLAPLMSYFTMDVITKIAFGQEYGYLKANKDLYSFLQEVREHWPKVAMRIDVPLFRDIMLNPLSLKLFGPSVTHTKGMGKLMGIAREFVGKRYDPNAKPQSDLLGSWIRNGLTKDQAEAEGLFLIIAGSETTASTLRVTLLNIITCPRVYNKLKQEIRDAVVDGKVDNPIKFEEAKRLPYLQAVIYEGLRMRPPALSLFLKVVPPGGDMVHGTYIPGGALIGTNAASLFSSPINFGDDAAIFRPERFYEANEHKRTEMERLVELGFGYGRFQCSGKLVAFMELYKVLFELFRVFDFQVARPASPWKSLSYNVFIERDMWVKVSEAEKIH